jgi:hypothetical protein
VSWIDSMKKSVTQHCYRKCSEAMHQNDSKWSTIYITFKQQPVMEPYMKPLVHPVTFALHKLRSSHFPFQRHLGWISNTHTACKLCDAAEEEDIAHFLLRCTAYRHRSALHKQIAHVKQFYNVQFQREVDDYFDADLPDNELCAHILSRTVPTPASPHTQKLPTLLWQSMWYTIFHELDNHLLILVTQRDAMLVAHTRNQLQKAIKHNRQLHKLRDCFSESAPTHVVETSHC